MASHPSFDGIEIAHVEYEPKSNLVAGSDIDASRDSPKIADDGQPQYSQLEAFQPAASLGKDEPIVTRRELWSYYRQSSLFS